MIGVLDGHICADLIIAALQLYMMVLHGHALQPDFISTLKSSIHLPDPVPVGKFCIVADAPIELAIELQVATFGLRIFPMPVLATRRV